MAKTGAKKTGKKDAPLRVYIVTGGSGASALQIVETVLAQFPALRLPILVRNHVVSLEQLKEAVKEAGDGGGILVHTLVDGVLRDALVRLGRESGVVTIDLMGPLMEQLSARTGAKPLGQPGMYRKLRKEYFDRIEAIDFAVSHDDGKRPEDLPLSDVVIVGVSRCGKTPLSMYLAVHGWKVANVPLVQGIPPPPELSRVDRRRVVGLGIGHPQLLEYRRRREERMGRAGMTAYASPSAVLEEVEAARRFCRDGGYRVVEVTDKPIEIVADEVVKLVTPSLNRSHPRPVPS